MAFNPKIFKVGDGTETAAVDANNNLNVSQRDGTNAADIDSDGNQSVSIRSGTDEVDVLTCDESGNKALPVVQEYSGDQISKVDSALNIANTATGTATCTAVTNGETGYLEQLILAVEGGPTRCFVKQDGSIIATFYLGGHMGTSTSTSHIADSIIWNCDFSGHLKIVGDGAKVWTVEFTNNCGVAMVVDAYATFVWREITT